VTGHAPPNGDVAGHTGVQLEFRNTSHHACVLYGYPGADGVDGAGHAVAHAARTTDGYLGGCGCSHPRGVLVKPGQSAYAIVEGDAGGGACDRFRGLVVTPPNTYRSTPIGVAPHSCHFQVHPVVPDDAGPQ